MNGYKNFIFRSIIALPKMYYQYEFFIFRSLSECT